MLTTPLPTYAVDVVLAQVGTPAPSEPPGGDKILMILSWGIWAAVIACISGFMIAATMLAYQRWQGGGGDAQGKLVGSMIGSALLGVAGTIVNTLVLGTGG